MPEKSVINNSEEGVRPQPGGAGFDGESRQILEKLENNSQEILRLSKKIHNYVVWRRIIDVFKLLIIIIPLILAWRLIADIKENPGLILENPWLKSYTEGLIEAVGEKIDPAALDIGNIPAEFRDRLR